MKYPKFAGLLKAYPAEMGLFEQFVCRHIRGVSM